MNGPLFIIKYPNGTIFCGAQGTTFQCENNPLMVKTRRDVSVDELKQLIHRKLKLQGNQVVSNLLYRCPISTNPLNYISMEVKEDDEMQVVIESHGQFNLNMEFCAMIVSTEAESSVQIPSTEEEPVPTNEEIPVHDVDRDVVLSDVENEENGLSSDGDDDSDNDDNNNENVSMPSNITYYVPPDFLSCSNGSRYDEADEVPGLIQASIWDENSDIKVGLMFETKEDLMSALKMYSIKRHQNFNVTKSAAKYVEVKCPNHDTCSWRVRACLKANYNMWMISVYDTEEHTCVSSMISQDHRKLDSDMIANAIVDAVNVSPDLPISQVIQNIKSLYDYTVSYRKAWIGKQKAIGLVYGNWEASYGLLRNWMAAVEQYNPGTIVHWQVQLCSDNDSTVFFHRVFWAYKPCIDAYAYMKPMIQVDGTFLYGKYRGTLLIGMAQDGNRNIIPVAFALVEAKTNEAWAWFLWLLRQHVIKERRTCLISDRHAGIMNAVKDERLGWQPPHGYHVYCIRHLASNLNSKYKDKRLKSLFVKIGYEFEKHVVDRKMAELRRINAEAANWIDKIPRERWCRAYDEGRRYGHMTTNLAECMNSVLKGVRSLPVTSLAQATLYRCATFFVDRGTSADCQMRAGHVHCEELQKGMRTNKISANSCLVVKFDRESVEFEVREPRNSQRRQFGRICKVNLNTNTCDCGEFKAFKFPCMHVIAACKYINHDFMIYVDPVYNLQTISNAYQFSFHPVGGEQYWPSVPGPRVVPKPSMIRPKGRPKSTRIRNEMDW